MALLLAGCSLFQQQRQGVPVPDDSAALQHWHVSGKVGIRLPDGAHSAYVEWSQRANAFDVLLFGPLGQGKSRLQGKPGAVQLHLANGDVWQDQSPEALLMKLYGWQLPVSRAQYWVKGRAAPGTPAQTRSNADGSLAHLEQDGWSIDYTDYMELAPLRLPRKMIMRYEQLRATLVISEWRALAPD
jgi:outer membrane lipoprotein LolB